MQKIGVLVAQLGARRHYQQPILFHQWGILKTLYTDFYSGNSKAAKFLRQSEIYNHLPSIIKKGLERYDPTLDKVRIIQFPWFGIQWTKAISNSSNVDKSSVKIWGYKQFCSKILKTNLTDVNVIYGFNGASLELFQYAKERGIRCILDQTLAESSLLHRLLIEEEQKWSNWSLLPFKVSDADIELMQREQKEQDLADHIICGSDFVKDSLVSRGVNANKISVIALGCSREERQSQILLERKKPQERGDGLRILFAGTVDLRKGIPYLLESLRQLKGEIPFTCKIAGSLGIKPERVAEYSDVCNFLGRVPRSQMTELYAWADVLVLPSICEGSAMVIYEALNFGLPVITTYNSGSIVRDGLDGWIVNIRDAQIITDKLLIFYHKSNTFNSVKSSKYLTDLYKIEVEKMFELITDQKVFSQIN